MLSFLLISFRQEVVNRFHLIRKFKLKEERFNWVSGRVVLVLENWVGSEYLVFQLYVKGKRWSFRY